MIGSAVYDSGNRDIGKVKDLIVNKDGTVTAVVVGRILSGKYVGVSPSDLRTDHDHLIVDLTRAQLHQAKDFQLEKATTWVPLMHQ